MTEMPFGPPFGICRMPNDATITAAKSAVRHGRRATRRAWPGRTPSHVSQWRPLTTSFVAPLRKLPKPPMIVWRKKFERLVGRHPGVEAVEPARDAEHPVRRETGVEAAQAIADDADRHATRSGRRTASGRSAASSRCGPRSRRRPKRRRSGHRYRGSGCSARARLLRDRRLLAAGEDVDDHPAVEDADELVVRRRRRRSGPWRRTTTGSSSPSARSWGTTLSGVSPARAAACAKAAVSTLPRGTSRTNSAHVVVGGRADDLRRRTDLDEARRPS